jgi:hypothetical protein
MFLPVGSTSGLRIGSPPGPGSTYSPSRAFQQTAQFVVGADLLQAEFQEFHQGLDGFASTLV